MPYSFWWPLLCGAATGLLLRLVFSGDSGQAYTPMLAAFVYLAPLVVGMVTVYVAERSHRRSWGYYAGSAAFANVLFVVGSLAILVEGLICAILILPLFTAIGAVGGLLMGLVCRFTNWPRGTLGCFAALPLLLGALGGDPGPRVHSVENVRRQVLVQAPASEVWQHLLDADRIAPGEVETAWMYRIGVPMPLAGVTEETADGLVRDVRMGKGIHFTQVASDWEPGRRVHWRYRFGPGSVPPGALDDHVRIGGDYFDLVGTTYRLTPRGQATVLEIEMQYRVSTDFDWYAEPLARWLIGDFSEVILDFYRVRSEAVAGTGPA
ncbi:SRPBCC family protein [Arenimonas aestuarii]